MGEEEKKADLGQGEIWQRMLKDLAGKNKTAETQHVVVLGDEQSGKTALVTALQGHTEEDDKRSLHAPLGYTYIDIRNNDDYEDDVARLSVWVADGNEAHKNLLKFAINKETISNLCAVIVVDLSQPWSIMESLKRWLEILEEYAEMATVDMTAGEVDALRQQVQDRFQGYEEPSDGTPKRPRIGSKRLSINFQDNDPKAPLGPNVLTTNLGIPIVVVGTKSDRLVSLEKEYSFTEAHFEYIQRSIRTLCMQYGAALIYCCADSGRNCSILKEYLSHVAYSSPFGHRSEVLEKDKIFVPIGFDSVHKIDILMGAKDLSRDDQEPYDRIIVRPTTKHRAEVKTDVSVEAMTEQDFLFSLKEQMDKDDLGKGILPGDDYKGRQQFKDPFKGVAGAAGAEDPLRRSKDRSKDKVAARARQALSPGEGEQKNQALTQFFSQLLNRDKAPVGKKIKQTARKQAAMALDSMKSSTPKK